MMRHDETAGNTSRENDIRDGGHRLPRPRSACGSARAATTASPTTTSTTSTTPASRSAGRGATARRCARATSSRPTTSTHRARSWLSDMGGIYTLGVPAGHRHPRQRASTTSPRFRYGGWGIYFDEGSSPASWPRTTSSTAPRTAASTSTTARTTWCATTSSPSAATPRSSARARAAPVVHLRDNVVVWTAAGCSPARCAATDSRATTTSTGGARRGDRLRRVDVRAVAGEGHRPGLASR